jgi:hypothetical protein
MIILSDHLINQLAARDASFWVANTSKDLVPELARANGVVVEDDRMHLTFFIPERYGKTFLSNCEINSRVSFLVAAIFTLESYQIKGKYISHKSCSEKEINLQEEYLVKLSTVLKELQLQGEKFLKSLDVQPSIAYTMSVEEIFLQTPKTGTGFRLTPTLL